jgi:hypothetical protein
MKLSDEVLACVNRKEKNEMFTVEAKRLSAWFTTEKEL